MQVNWTKGLPLWLKSISIITGILVSLSDYSIPLLAQSSQITSNRPFQLQISFIPANTEPPDRGTPPASEGTGSRGDCFYKQDMPPPTRLVGSHPLKLTFEKYPTFWVYVPYTPQEATDGEFSLQDGDSEVYLTHFQLPATPGIVGISLPPTVPPLAVGKEYRWYFDINCPRSPSSDESAAPASLTGLVQRISVSAQLERELNAAKTPLQRIATYARHGIWYEALAELAQLRLHEPKNPMLQKTWIELLSDRTVDLAKIAQEPIVGKVISK